VWLLERTDDAEIKEAISNINTLRIKPAYPFLLQVFIDYDNKIISKDDVLEIMEVIQSYVFRRQIAGVGSHGHNRTFSRLHSYVDVEKPETYVDTVKAVLTLKHGYERFPDDVEFARELCQADLYNMKINNYVLLRLENFDRTKEKIISKNVTIEHIMPQNKQPPKCWQDDLGNDWESIQAKYLHTLGNLTITELNSEMSDKCIQEKVKICFKSTPYKLSDDLRGLEHWNKEKIKKRSDRLADLALKIWKYPDLSQDTLSKYSELIEDNDDDDEDVIDSTKWDTARTVATQEVIRVQDKLIQDMKEKFNCITAPQQEHFHFYTKLPIGIRNTFAAINCTKTVFTLWFRVDPETFIDDNPKIKLLPSKKGWFFKKGIATERKMRVYDPKDSDSDNKSTYDTALEALEHAYRVTDEQTNYKTKP
jgi:hypothetical protein